MVAWELTLVVLAVGGLLAIVLQRCLRNIFEKSSNVVRYTTEDLEDIKREAEEIRNSAGRINQRIRGIEEVASSRGYPRRPPDRDCKEE